jgi:DNA polymerase III delta prime subunit
MDTKELHHANIAVGKDCRDFVFEILEKQLNFNMRANPDFLLVENQVFGIDEARDFEKWVIGKPLVGEVKVSLIIAESITREAQNALLKVLEEPSSGTYIFLNFPSLGGLLPTFLSRVRVLNMPKIDFEIDVASKKFLSSQIKDKFAIIRSLSKKNPSADGKNEMRELIKNLEGIAYKNNFKSQDLKNILIAKIFAGTRGSSPKMLLEWLACVL